MYAESFQFDGIESSDKGYYIFGYDGFNNSGVGVAGSEITFNSTKPASSYKWNYHGARYETQLQTSFQIGKETGEELTRDECAFLLRWLVRKDGYHMLHFNQTEFEDTYFNAQMNLQWIRLIDGRIVGAELSVTCDAPFGYSELKTKTVNFTHGTAFTITDDSDEIGAKIFDKMVLTSSSATDKITIQNDLELVYCPNNSSAMEINNVSNGEIITVQNHYITTSSTTHDIADDFNYKYLRLINIYSQAGDTRINKYTVSGGSGTLVLEYRTIRKVMP